MRGLRQNVTTCNRTAAMSTPLLLGRKMPAISRRSPVGSGENRCLEGVSTGVRSHASLLPVLDSSQGVIPTANLTLHTHTHIASKATALRIIALTLSHTGPWPVQRIISLSALISSGGSSAPDWATEGMPTYLQSTASCEFYSFLMDSSSPHATTIMDRHAVNVWAEIR